MAPTFHKISPTLYVTHIRKQRADIYNRRFTANEACRAIKEDNGWRIDFSGNVCGAWLPWEPITSTPYPNLKEALKAIRTYADSTPQ
jgi:hypothetical protein